jgi:hypothetical protein
MPLFNGAQNCSSFIEQCQGADTAEFYCQNLATLKKIVASSLLVLNILPVWVGDLSKSGDGNAFVCPCSQTSRHVWAPLQLIMCRGQSAGVELICSCALLDVWIPQLPRSSHFPRQPDLTLLSQCCNCRIFQNFAGEQFYSHCISPWWGDTVGMCIVYIPVKKRQLFLFRCAATARLLTPSNTVFKLYEFTLDRRRCGVAG